MDFHQTIRTKPKPKASWADDQTLVSLRRGFFHNSRASKNRRLQENRGACALVNDWVRRGEGVPHAILSTADLVTARLVDEDETESAHAKQASYERAISNFVTSVTEALQTGREKKSMYEIGRGIGLAGALVTTRHNINHGVPTSLTELRRISKLALEWLHQGYWMYIASSLRGCESPDLFETYRQAFSSFVTDLSNFTDNVSRLNFYRRTVKTLVLLGNGDVGLYSAQIEVLLEPGHLLPTDRKLGDPVDLDTPLIQLLYHMSIKHPEVMHCLMDALMFSLVKGGDETSPQDARLEGHSFFVSHLCTDDWWVTLLKKCIFPVSRIIKICELVPHHWTRKLVKGILTSSHHVEEAIVFGDRIALAFKDSHASQQEQADLQRDISENIAKNPNPWEKTGQAKEPKEKGRGKRTGREDDKEITQEDIPRVKRLDNEKSPKKLGKP